MKMLSPLPILNPPFENRNRAQPPLAAQGRALPRANPAPPPAQAPARLPAHAPARLPAHVPMDGVIVQPEAHEPMQVDAPHHRYPLRKRAGQSLGPNPVLAKRLRIACVDYTAGWKRMHG